MEEESVEITVTQRADTQSSFGEKTIADQTYITNSQMADLTLSLATGGNSTLTYSLTKKVGSGLPTGLSFNTSTRVLSETPTTGAGAVVLFAFVAFSQSLMSFDTDTSQSPEEVIFIS